MNFGCVKHRLLITHIFNKLFNFASTTPLNLHQGVHLRYQNPTLRCWTQIESCPDTGWRLLLLFLEASPPRPLVLNFSEQSPSAHDTCTRNIVHACTMVIVDACTMIMIHAYTMTIVRACISTTILVQACTMILVHVSCHTGLMFGAIQVGGLLGAKPPGVPGVLGGRQAPELLCISLT